MYSIWFQINAIKMAQNDHLCLLSKSINHLVFFLKAHSFSKSWLENGGSMADIRRTFSLDHLCFALFVYFGSELQTHIIRFLVAEVQWVKPLNRTLTSAKKINTALADIKGSPP